MCVCVHVVDFQCPTDTFPMQNCTGDRVAACDWMKKNRGANENIQLHEQQRSSESKVDPIQQKKIFDINVQSTEIKSEAGCKAAEMRSV